VRIPAIVNAEIQFIVNAEIANRELSEATLTGSLAGVGALLPPGGPL
jgi:hypothetical protein